MEIHYPFIFFLLRRRLEEIRRKEELEKQEREELEHQRREEERRRREEQQCREREEQKRLELERQEREKIEKERLERERLEKERQQREKEELEKHLVQQKLEEEKQRRLKGEKMVFRQLSCANHVIIAEEARMLQSAKSSWTVQQDLVNPIHTTLSLVQIQKEEHIQAVKEQVRDFPVTLFQVLLPAFFHHSF